MDATKAEIINQIRELNALLIQAKLHVGRSKLAHHFHRDELDSDMPGLHGQGRLLGILGLNPGTSETTSRDLGYILGMSRQAVTVLHASPLLQGRARSAFLSRVRVVRL